MSKKADRDPFKDKLTYNAACRMLPRLFREIVHLSVRVRNYTHARVLKEDRDNFSADYDLAELVQTCIMQAATQIRIAEQLMGRLMHDETMRRIKKDEK